MDTALSDPLVGRLLDGRYRVESRIARGGMATVYTALDTRLERIVALKVMHPALGDDHGFLTRFNREAKAAARLSHPNVVSVFDQGEDGDNLYLAMEYVEGRTLRDLLRERGRLTPDQALSVLEPVVSALRAAHAAGLVHRDIKPENVLLADDGRIKVADFGLARALATAEHTSTAGILIGTVAYLSPEQVERGTSDARSDVYSVGVLLYEMLVGSPPYDGDTAWAVASRHVNEDVPLPSSVVPGVPRALDEIVRAATRRDPSARPADAAELLQLVGKARATVHPTQVIAGLAPIGARSDVPPSAHTQVLAAPVVGSPDVVARRARRRWPLVLAAVLVLALVGGGLGYYFAALRGAEVPNVVGLQPAAAVQKLTDEGLEAARGEAVFSSTIPPGQVAETTPAVGTHVDDGETVTYHLSKGLELYDVPKLRGKTVEEAEDLLGELKLDRGDVSRKYSMKVEENRIISTAPGAGTALAPGEPVDLVVSDGPPPVEVQNVVGEDVATAERILRGIGLRPEIREEFSDDVRAGRVMSQDPVRGTVDKGSTVQLTVSKGPQLFPVPDVEGQHVDDAVAAIEQAGFVADVRRPLGFGSTVRAQDPDGGEQHRKGTVVTLVVY